MLNATNPAREAADRGAEWLRERLNAEGQLRGATNLSAYYKTPCAFLWSGDTAAAEQVLGHVRQRYLQPDGDLDGTGLGWFEDYRIYPHAWLACGAAALGDHATAERLVRFLLTRRNAESGGFRTRHDDREEIMTTSMAGLACLAAGEMEAAAGVTGWLRRVFDEQPDLKAGLVHVWQPGVGLVRGDGSAAYVVDATRPRQWYFQYGISAAFLAEYARKTRDGEAVKLAQRYLHASAHAAEDRYQTPQSGKVGWGAAWTYQRTGDPAEARLVLAVVDGLTALQCGDGSWNAEGVYEAKPASGEEARYDVTAEFVALLAQMGAEIVI